VNNLILDIGCGSKPWGNVNLDLNVDASTHHKFRYDPKNMMNFTNGDAQRLPYRDKCFDIIVSRHCLEHLPFPLLALQDWSRVARYKVVIEIPNRPAIQEHSDHLYSWSSTSLTNLCRLVFPAVDVQITGLTKYLYENPITGRILRKSGYKQFTQRGLFFLLKPVLVAICKV